MIKAKKPFFLKGKFYSENDEVKINDFADLIKLNENGFITPLNIKQLQEEKEKIEKKEEK